MSVKTQSKPKYFEDSLIEWQTVQAKSFRNICDAMKTRMPDTSFFFTKGGLLILHVDSFKQFIVNINLAAENFESYYCRTEFSDGQEIPVELNISMQNLCKIFKLVSSDDTKIRWVYRDKSPYVDIWICSDKKDEDRHYQVPIQQPDADAENGNITDIHEYPYSLTMPCSDLQRICREFKNFDATTIDIIHDGTLLCFTSPKTKVPVEIIRRGTTEAASDKDIKFEKLPVGKDSVYKCTFSFDLVNDFGKCQSGGDNKTVRLMLLQDSPMILEYMIGSLGTMLIAISPHISEDKDD